MGTDDAILARMSAKSDIEWTDSTWNPVRGCTKVSPGCAHCYAEVFAERFRGVPGHPYEQGFDLRLWPDRLVLPLRWRRPRMVFVNSMSDLFHPGVSFEFVTRVFTVMGMRPRHTFLVLTKRPERAREYLTRKGAVPPLPNVHLGVSVEDQATADERIPVLLDTPAAVRWVSYEPALERVYFSSLHPPGFPHDVVDALNGTYRGGLDVPRLDWIVIGGESGPGARPFDVAWARSTIEQGKAAGVPVFVKQGGASNACEHDRKGGCLACMPEDLRIREYPNAT
jgi:protein gp37